MNLIVSNSCSSVSSIILKFIVDIFTQKSSRPSELRTLDVYGYQINFPPVEPRSVLIVGILGFSLMKVAAQDP